MHCGGQKIKVRTLLWCLEARIRPSTTRSYLPVCILYSPTSGNHITFVRAMRRKKGYKNLTLLAYPAAFRLSIGPMLPALILTSPSCSHWSLFPHFRISVQISAICHSLAITRHKRGCYDCIAIHIFFSKKGTV